MILIYVMFQELFESDGTRSARRLRERLNHSEPPERRPKAQRKKGSSKSLASDKMQVFTEKKMKNVKLKMTRAVTVQSELVELQMK